jgi:hypothetical protein
VHLWRCLNCSDRQVARELGINQYYVSQLVRHGIEPTDKTITGQSVRMQLFLPRIKPKPRTPKPEEWTGQKRVQKHIREMHKDTTHEFNQWRKIDDRSHEN